MTILRNIILLVVGMGVLGTLVFFVWNEFGNNTPEGASIVDSFRVSEPPPPEPDHASIENEDTKGTTTKKEFSLTPNAPAFPTCTGDKLTLLKCYRDYYQAYVSARGGGAALKDLESHYGDPFIHAECHQITHVIGRAAADVYPTVSEAFANGNGFCWSGYYHGVMEGVVAKVGKANLATKLDSICAEIPGKSSYSFDYYNCVHGLGHGVMGTHNNELFDSLSMCDNLTGAWEQVSCGSGAYMENVIADGVYHAAKYLKPEDPLYPCNASPEKYKTTCYLMQTSYMLKLVGYEFSKVFELCRGVEEIYMNTCFQSLGRDASGSTISNLEKTRSYCMLGRDYREQSNCVVGAVKDFVSYFHSDVEARKLCNSLPSEELTSVCIHTTASYYAIF